MIKRHQNHQVMNVRILNNAHIMWQQNDQKTSRSSNNKRSHPKSCTYNITIEWSKDVKMIKQWLFAS